MSRLLGKGTRPKKVRYSILPILIGDGIPFFEKLDRDIAALHLAAVKAYKSGMVAVLPGTRTSW